MARTFSQLKNQIAALEARAARVKQAEIVDVIKKIKVAVQAYNLTEAELFGNASSPTTATKKTAATSKYSDGQGAVWGGRGPRPKWLRDAIASGKDLSSFLTASPSISVGSKPETAPTVGKSTRKRAKARGARRSKGQPYSDGTHTWGGRGPRPAWFKAALAEGKTLEELKVRPT